MAACNLGGYHGDAMSASARLLHSLISTQPAPMRVVCMLDVAALQMTAARMCRDVKLEGPPTFDVLRAISEIGQRLLRDRCDALLSLRAMREGERVCLILVLEFIAPDGQNDNLSAHLSGMDEIVISGGAVTRIVAVKWGLAETIEKIARQG